MADNYAAVGTNALKLVGDGAAGIGPYTRFGTRQLQAIQVTSSAYDFTTTPAASNSNMYKAVNALGVTEELFYVGKPTASGSNNFVAIVAAGTEQDGSGAALNNDGTYSLAEANILAALGGSGSVTINKVTLTGGVFS